MKGWLRPLTIRRWSIDQRAWFFGWLVATLFCWVTGPFGTGDAYSNGVLAAYWATANGVAVVLIAGIRTALSADTDLNYWRNALITSVAFATIYLPILFVLELILSGYSELMDSLQIVVFRYLAIILISVLIHGIVWWVKFYGPNIQNETSGAPNVFRNRLQKHPQASVWAVSADDHYIQVTTDQGTEILLLRFSDALTELEAIEGIQTHRSHWVSRVGAQKVENLKSGPQVILQNGESIPISRRNKTNVLKFFN